MITGLTWYSSLTNDFTGYDDFKLIVNNPNIQNGFWHAFKLYFFKPSTSFNLAWSDMPTTIYRPLEWLMSSLAYSVWGANAWAFHFFVNFLIHIINSILIFLILKRVFGAQANAELLAWIITLVWAVHPLHHESVNMLTSGLGFLTSTLFMLLGIYLICNEGASSPERMRKDLTVSCIRMTIGYICFAISFFGVEMVLIGPALLTLVLLSRNQSLKRAIVPWLILFAYFLLRFKLSSELHYLPMTLADCFERVFVLAPQILLHYFKLFFYPASLTIDQHHNVVLENFASNYHWLSLLLLASLLLLIIYFAINKSSRLNPLIAGFGFLLILGLAMTLNIIPVYCLARDRYTYFFVLALVALLILFLEKFLKISNRPCLTMVVVSVVILVLGCVSSTKNKDWHNGETLWKQTIASVNDLGAKQIWRYSLIHYWEDSKTEPDMQVLEDFAYFMEQNNLDQNYEHIMAQANAPGNYLRAKYGYCYNKTIATALYVLAERLSRFGFEEKSKIALLLSRKYYPEYFQTNMAIYLSKYYSSLDKRFQDEILSDLQQIGARNKLWHAQLDKVVK